MFQVLVFALQTMILYKFKLDSAFIQYEEDCQNGKLFGRNNKSPIMKI